MPRSGPRIVGAGGPVEGEEFFLRPGENRIGRIADNDIVIRDRSISRRHAIILVQEGDVVIEDCGSHNGVEVNGTKLQRCQLVNGLQFKLGDCVFTYMDEAPQAPSRPLPAPKEVLPARRPKKDQDPAVVTGNWEELFGAAGVATASSEEQVATGQIETFDIFDEDESPEATRTHEQATVENRRQLLVFLLLLIGIIGCGMYLLVEQSKQELVKKYRTHILRKGEKRILLVPSFKDISINEEDSYYIRAKRYRFMPKRKDEPSILLLVEGLTPGAGFITLKPSGYKIQIIVQGLVGQEESPSILDSEQRAKLGRVLLASAKEKMKEDLAGALNDLTEAERILKPVKVKQMVLYGKVERALRKCKAKIDERIDELKDKYYAKRKSSPRLANRFLKDILELVPDPMDPEHQATKLILQVRRKRLR